MSSGTRTDPPGESPPAPGVELIPFDSSEALAAAAAGRWLTGLDSSRTQTVALSGGRITRAFFPAIVRTALSRSQRLAGLHFFWADERCVPPDHADSNYAFARRHVLDRLGIPEGQIHRIRGEIEPSKAAAEASRELERVAIRGEAGQPILDWVFLGMGEDGHVASLFPGASNSEAAPSAGYLAVVAPKPPPLRITLSFAALAVARQVWVLVSGAGKERALAESMSPTGQTPLARLVRSRRSTLIFSEVRLVAKRRK